MARLNNTNLIGVVVEPPQIAKDPETGEYRFGMGTLKVVRGARNAQDGTRHLVYAQPIVFTRESLQIREMETWKVNDLVRVSGIFATSFIKKTSYCKGVDGKGGCGAANRKEGSFGYVQPIPNEQYPAMRVIRSFDTQEEALEELKMWAIDSNVFKGIGCLGRDPKRLVLSGKTGRQVVVCQYPVVLNRLVYVPSDPAEKTNDYPWVKSYGSHCDTDYFRLRKSSAVYIDGFLQVRKLRRHAKCDCCGQPYDWQDVTMEIVPYEVEYLQNFRTEEEAEKIQAERREQSAKDILESIRNKLGASSVNESGITEGEITDVSDLEKEV